MVMNKYTYNGKQITLTQQAYLTGKYGNAVYKAAAVDDDGNEYMVIWHPYDRSGKGCEDESDACNWDTPAEIKLTAEV